MQFEHDGKQYEVFAMTVFQADMRNSYVVQIGGLLQKHLGVAEFEDLPRSMDRLVAYFVDWHLCTVIDSKRLNLVTLIDVDSLLDFFALIGNDDELANKWLKAYREANKLNRDPVTEKNEVAPVNESEQ